MGKVVAVRQGGRTILVETDDTTVVTAAPVQASGVQPARAGFEEVSDVGEKVRDAVSDVATLIRETSDMVLEGITQIGTKVSKVELKFGVKFAGEAGFAVITKASAEAQLEVTLEWTP